MSTGKDKSARNSRIMNLMEKWRNDFAHLSTTDLKEVQEVLEYLLDERFYARGNR